MPVSTWVLASNQQYEIRLYQGSEKGVGGFMPEACHFRVEHHDSLTGMTRTILHTRGSEFLRVGLGNIDKVNLIEDGDIGHYPTYAYFSKA